MKKPTTSTIPHDAIPMNAGSERASAKYRADTLHLTKRKKSHVELQI